MPIESIAGKIETNPSFVNMRFTCPVHEAAGNARIYLDAARRIVNPSKIYSDDHREGFCKTVDVFARKSNAVSVMVSISSRQGEVNNSVEHRIVCGCYDAVIIE